MSNPAPGSIGDHGLIGDTRTAALVTSDGVIDWMCVPRFDGSPVFGRLVGGAAAGSFRVGPAEQASPRSRRYRLGTATLETIWDVGGATLTLTEGMVAELSGQLLPATILVRRLTAVGGPIAAEVTFDPRFGDRHAEPRTRRTDRGIVCSWGATAVALDSAPSLTIEPGVPVGFTVDAGCSATFVLAVADREPLVQVGSDAAWALLERDGERWRRWTDDIDADLPFRDEVARSLLTLRLLTYSPSGAPVAAPTTSLPEVVGGTRNWDYRFAWPRDASIGVGAFLGAGKRPEARHFLAWLLHASRLDRPHLPVLLTIHGRHPRSERVLDDWPGYADSRPVRVGNAAADQHQLDAYGWILDAACLYEEAGHRLNSEMWRAVAGFADHVARLWREPDAGIWELRDDARHHVHSKLMAWLALDRALRIADRRRVGVRRRRRWSDERAALADEVRQRGFDEERGCYTRSYGSHDLDAALLVLPLLGVEAPASPRVRGTIDAIARELDAGAALVYRYPPGHDGLDGVEGAFMPCAFWLVQALAATGRVDEAAQRLDALVECANPLGLFSEELDPTTHELLGNFPQALTHAAFVQAVLALRDARCGAGRDTWS